MQYKVPQNVDIEDRVIGPLTLRQFMIMLVGVGLIIVMNYVFVGFLRILFWLFAAIITAIVVIFAFVKYGDQKMEVFFLSAIKTVKNPRRRIWKKEGTILQETKKAVPQEKKEIITPKKNIDEARSDFQHLAELVDSGGYSAINRKDRVLATPEPEKSPDADVKDILEESEKPNQNLDAEIKTAKAPTAPEPKISQVASVSPNQNFDYPKIETSPKKIEEQTH